MRTRSSTVLGKRPHNDHVLPSPDSSPPRDVKRVKTAGSLVGEVEDGEGNKENRPPFEFGDQQHTRSLRRTSTSDSIPPPPEHSLRRYASTSTLPHTPTAATSRLAHLSLASPPATPPAALLPAHVRARALLRASANAELAGRDVERGVLTHFLDDNDNDDGPRTMYISGAPGSGKTALVNAVLEGRSVVFVNCMAVPSVDAFWEELRARITDCTPAKTAKGKGKGRQAVVDLLRKFAEPCTIVLDELDHLAALVPQVLALARDVGRGGVRVIGIANTHTLVGAHNTHTLTNTNNTQAAASTEDVQTLHFAPYTPPQLLAILDARLAPLSSPSSSPSPSSTPSTSTSTPSSTASSANNAAANRQDAATTLFPPPARRLLAQKVAAVSGDVRVLLAVARGALELAVAAVGPPTSDGAVPGGIKGEKKIGNDDATMDVDENPLGPRAPRPVVSPAHVLAALKAYSPASSNASKSTKPSTANTNTSVNQAKSSGNTNTNGSGNPTSAQAGETAAKVRALGLHARLVLACLLLAQRRAEFGLSASASKASASSPSKSKSTSTSKSKSTTSPTRSKSTFKSTATPTTTRTLPTTPSKPRPSSSPSSAIDVAHLHAYYSSALSSSSSSGMSGGMGAGGGMGGGTAPVSRSEFADLLGVLETVGLVSFSSSPSPSTPSRSPSKKRVFGRTASSSSMGLGGGSRAGGGIGGAGGGVRLAEGVLSGEVLRGLVEGEGVQAEEVRAVWDREGRRIRRECGGGQGGMGMGGEGVGFVGAEED
ncbi:hypothetical protein PLICRDRAFT_37115 [Plicaturopsis crispa FD-325 SS-3]|nr:hypothetical protein PLICRDRAFT_37115 [Plicaturopsis crispa FD-325 SS-3]